MTLDKKVTISTLLAMKRSGQKFAMLTSYDATTAALQQAAGVESLLVGDSLGMTILGEPDTVTVGMDVSVALTKAVRRGAPLCYVVADMPFMSYATVDSALENAGRYLAEARADAVKLEVDRRHVSVVAELAKAGVPVMAHLGILPQRVAQAGGYRVQGKSAAGAIELVESARMMIDAGATSLLLEGVPPEPAALIAQRSPVPVIGCGAGPGCDGSVLVVHDVLGLGAGHVPTFAKQYARLDETIRDACRQYAEDVHAGRYPAEEHNYKMDADQAEQLKRWAEQQR